MPLIDPRVLSGLQLVTRSHSDFGAERVPDFVLAGPNRTGSTWVHDQFDRHPQVFLAKPKEIHYFSTLGMPHHPLHESDDLDWYVEHFRLTRKRVAERRARCRANFGRKRRWDPTVIGEASASYAAMDDTRVGDLVRLSPDLKVLITVRHPIARAWSHAKFDLCVRRHRAIKDVPAEEIERYFGRRWVWESGLYSEMRAKWSRHLAPGNLLLALFDDIVERPVDLLQRIARFIGVDDNEALFVGVKQVKNPSEKTEAIPEPLLDRLRDFYRDELAFLSDEFGVDWRLR